MTASRLKLLIIGVVVIGLGLLAYYRLYDKPRRVIVDDIATLKTSIDSYEQMLADARGSKARLQRIASTTLGESQAVVEARFRSSLGEIARHVALTDVVANSGRPKAAMNPAASSSPRVPGEFGKMLGRGADFYVLEGSLTGVGTLDQVLTALATVQSQSWVHRIGAVTIKPVGADRERFELRLDAIATIIMPDLVDPDAPSPGWTTVTRDQTQRWAPIVSKNIFRVPRAAPPPPVTNTAPEPEPTPPATPPYDQWQLTGLPGGTSGRVAAMSNTRTNESLLLELGAYVLDAQLIELDRFSAIFQIGDGRYEVLMGQTLAERREIP